MTELIQRLRKQAAHETECAEINGTFEESHRFTAKCLTDAADRLGELEPGTTQIGPEHRAAFEAWLLDEQMLTSTWNDERNCYDEFPAHLAFKAWIFAKGYRMHADTPVAAAG